MYSQEFQPKWISAPGDTISDILRERDVSVIEFAQLIEQTPEEVTNLLEGYATITLALARQLEQTLGASVEFWMSRDFQYRQNISRLPGTHKKWLKELPVGDMIKFGWINPIPHPSEEEAACLKFFNLGSVDEWYKTYSTIQEMAIFQTSPSFDSRPAAVAAWLRKGEIDAELIECQPWNAEKFKESFTEIRSLTRKKDPRRFIPMLQKCCANSGVAVVVARIPSGCRASGATYFISEGKAILMLSFRYLTDDHFWFTFFHEAAHLLLHSDKGIFLEINDAPKSELELEANEFSERILIPPEYKSSMLSLPLNGREVIRFAVRIGVSPGIVVGQLQHHGRIQYNQLNQLKRRYRWED